MHLNKLTVDLMSIYRGHELIEHAQFISKESPIFLSAVSSYTGQQVSEESLVSDIKAVISKTIILASGRKYFNKQLVNSSLTTLSKKSNLPFIIKNIKKLDSVKLQELGTIINSHIANEQIAPLLYNSETGSLIPFGKIWENNSQIIKELLGSISDVKNLLDSIDDNDKEVLSSTNILDKLTKREFSNKEVNTSIVLENNNLKLDFTPVSNIKEVTGADINVWTSTSILVIDKFDKDVNEFDDIVKEKMDELKGLSTAKAGILSAWINSVLNVSSVILNNTLLNFTVISEALLNSVRVTGIMSLDVVSDSLRFLLSWVVNSFVAKGLVILFLVVTGWGLPLFPVKVGLVGMDMYNYLKDKYGIKVTV